MKAPERNRREWEVAGPIVILARKKEDVVEKGMNRCN
jgi:hypothetical protein